MPAQCGEQRVGFGLGGVEAADKPRKVLTTPVKAKTIGLKRIHNAIRDFEEDFVDFDRG